VELALDKKHSFTEGEKLSSSIAMIMTLISLSMLFATLFLGYLAYRLTSEIWPPVGMGQVSLGLPTISTMIILSSSFTYLMFENTKKLLWLNLTTLLGSGFMVSQLFFWDNLKKTGIFTDTTIFASMIYAFTWIHAAHVVSGLCALLFLWFQFNRKNCELWIKNVGQFWHFLGIIWFVMFIGIFVL
jgi:cytochrome c oxidase subunit 3